MAADIAMEDDIEDLYGDVLDQEAANSHMPLNNVDEEKSELSIASKTNGAESQRITATGLPGLQEKMDQANDNAISEPVSAQDERIQVLSDKNNIVNSYGGDVVATNEAPATTTLYTAEDTAQDTEQADAANQATNRTEHPSQTLTVEELSQRDLPQQSAEPIAQDQPEWEMDSSPYESSSDESSDSSSSGDEEDYQLLDPAEEARRLMAEEGNSDDDGTSKDAKGSRIKSHNEATDEPVEMPNINVTSEMAIEELGAIENIVDNIALIKAKTSGEFQVLEARSLLCLKDRKVIGVVSETLGRVHQPLYCVRFRSQEAINEAGVGKGTVIYYVPQHSTFVFTQALRNLKGSDASNIYDEEAADDEIEFSDDEAEAEFKRARKTQRQARRGGKTGPSDDPIPPVNYDDGPHDDHYTPLSRPANLHEMMSPYAGSSPATARGSRGGRGPRNDRGHSRGRGRGHHDRGDFYNGARGRGATVRAPAQTHGPSLQNVSGYNPGFAGAGSPPFPFQQPALSQSLSHMGYAGYQPHPPYPNAHPAAPYQYQWGPPPAGASQQQQSQHYLSSQYPAGVAINPWFLQGQPPPNNGQR